MRTHTQTVLRRARKIYWSSEIRQDFVFAIVAGCIGGLSAGVGIAYLFLFIFF